MRLAEAVRTAYAYMDEPYLVDACCGGVGPLAKYSELAFSDYLRSLEESKIAERRYKAKRAQRRKTRSTWA